MKINKKRTCGRQSVGLERISPDRGIDFTGALDWEVFNLGSRDRKNWWVGSVNTIWRFVLIFVSKALWNWYYLKRYVGGLVITTNQPAYRLPRAFARWWKVSFTVCKVFGFFLKPEAQQTDDYPIWTMGWCAEVRTSRLS